MTRTERIAAIRQWATKSVRGTTQARMTIGEQVEALIPRGQRGKSSGAAERLAALAGDTGLAAAYLRECRDVYAAWADVALPHFPIQWRVLRHLAVEPDRAERLHSLCAEAKAAGAVAITMGWITEACADAEQILVVDPITRTLTETPELADRLICGGAGEVIANAMARQDRRTSSARKAGPRAPVNIANNFRRASVLLDDLAMLRDDPDALLRLRNQEDRDAVAVYLARLADRQTAKVARELLKECEVAWATRRTNRVVDLTSQPVTA
jgi:hypothetical protein